MTHPRLHTPIVAIVVTALFMLVLTLFTTFISALTISALVRLIVYATTCAGLPVLRHTSAMPRPAFLAPAGAIISAAAVTLSVWLFANSTWGEVRLVGIASVVGFVLYVPYALRKDALERVKRPARTAEL
jgi:amino acid transporter